MRLLSAIIVVFLFSCKAKTPYNPYLKMKKDEKPSVLINNEHVNAENESKKKGKKQLRKNRRKVYFH
jgi:hypothetical protein